MKRTRSSTCLLASLIALASAATATEDKTMRFSRPTNSADATVTVEIDPGNDVRVTIPPGTTAVQKRNLIRDALIAGGYDVTDNGPTGNELTIRYLRNGTKVSFRPGSTGELRDDVLCAAAVHATVAFEGLFLPFPGPDQPAVFTAGIVTDVGELTAQVSAQELNFQTDGPIICQALFQRLAPRAPQYGAQINYAGDRLEVYFDPAYTVTQGGIIFGTSSFSPGASGSVETPPAPQCPEDVNGDGVVDLSDLALVLGAFGSAAGDPAYNPAADIDGDGVIGLSDLSRVLGRFGATCNH
jgi:Dockerin type I domain